MLFDQPTVSNSLSSNKLLGIFMDAGNERWCANGEGGYGFSSFVVSTWFQICLAM